MAPEEIRPHRHRAPGRGSGPKVCRLPEDRKAVVRLLWRLLRNALGTPSRAHLRRSFELDSSLYRFFLHEGNPYLAIASMTPKERIVIPLKGFPVKTVAGNIRVIVALLKRTVAVHIPVRCGCVF